EEVLRDASQPAAIEKRTSADTSTIVYCFMILTKRFRAFILVSFAHRSRAADSRAPPRSLSVETNLTIEGSRLRVKQIGTPPRARRFRASRSRARGSRLALNFPGGSRRIRPG